MASDRYDAIRPHGRCRTVWMENYYDYEAGRWVTQSGRYEAIEQLPRFLPLADPFLAGTPMQTWELLLELLETVPEDLIPYVGCGPLEDFLNAHAESFVDQLEEEAATNPRFRTAVVAVNLARGKVPPDIEARLLAAFGPSFEFFVDPGDTGLHGSAESPSATAK